MPFSEIFEKTEQTVIQAIIDIRNRLVRNIVD